jgi:hypothetical protein
MKRELIVVAWIEEQLYNLNIFEIIITTALATHFGYRNLTKEVAAISKDIYDNAEEIKDTIRENKGK